MIIKNLKVLLFCFSFIIITSCCSFALTKSRDYPRYKNCLSNQRVILSAIEMYNLDFPDSVIQSFDDNSSKLLLEKNYLKVIPEGPELKCKYHYTAEFSEKGDVYCEYHGGVDSKKFKPSPEFAEILEGYLRYRDKEKFNNLLGIVVAGSIWLCGIVILVKGLVWIIGSFDKLKKNEQNTNNKQETISENGD